MAGLKARRQQGYPSLKPHEAIDMKMFSKSPADRFSAGRASAHKPPAACTHFKLARCIA